MPRDSTIGEEDLEVPFLQILDEEANADEDRMPAFPEEMLLNGYRTMVLARRFDERRLKLQRTGRIGTFAPVMGQEAAQVGTAATLRSDDWLVPSYRETAALMLRGADPADLLFFDAGYNEGINIPEDDRNLPNAVPVGTQMLHAVGIAYAARMRGGDEVAMSYFGDGATSQGDFHEAMNFAAVFDCPVVFVCQNNQYAISVPRERQTRSQTLAQKALAYGMHGIQVDGNDIFAAYVAAQEAVRRAREDKAPTLIECVTYRMEMHTTADDPTRYREDEEVERWGKYDPIARFGKYLEGRGLLDEDKRKAIEEEALAAIKKAWKQASKRIKKAEGAAPMFEHIFAERPPELERQRKRMVEAEKAGGDGDA